jgi:hypothetical protein
VVLCVVLGPVVLQEFIPSGTGRAGADSSSRVATQG